MFEHLHPKLVHFPIALVITAMILDVMGSIVKKDALYHAARYVFSLAAFFSILSLFTGLAEADRLHLNHPVLFAHRSYAFVLTVFSVIFSVALFFIPERYKRPIFTIMLLICTVLVVATGHYGGQMVYGYGIGIDG